MFYTPKDTRGQYVLHKISLFQMYYDFYKIVHI